MMSQQNTQYMYRTDGNAHTPHRLWSYEFATRLEIRRNKMKGDPMTNPSMGEWMPVKVGSVPHRILKTLTSKAS